MVEWMKKRLESIGATTELADVGMQTLPGGKQIPLPNVLLATLGNVIIFNFYLFPTGYIINKSKFMMD